MERLTCMELAEMGTRKADQITQGLPPGTIIRIEIELSTKDQLVKLYVIIRREVSLPGVSKHLAELHRSIKNDPYVEIDVDFG